jgi:membrane-associated phospholipid phosphatase
MRLSVLCGLLALLTALLFIDKPLAQIIYTNHLDVDCSFLWWLTVFGESAIYLTGLLLLALFLQFVMKRTAWASRVWFLWLCVLVPNVICIGLKIIAGRARPLLWLQDHIYGFYGVQLHSSYWSFPSGHTTTIMGLAIGLCVLLPRFRVVYVFVALLVVLSRVVLLQHYLSDVIAATLLTGIEIAVLIRALHYYRLDLIHGK